MSCNGPLQKELKGGGVPVIDGMAIVFLASDDIHCSLISFVVEPPSSSTAPPPSLGHVRASNVVHLDPLILDTPRRETMLCRRR